MLQIIIFSNILLPIEHFNLILTYKHRFLWQQILDNAGTNKKSDPGVNTKKLDEETEELSRKYSRITTTTYPISIPFHDPPIPYCTALAIIFVIE